MLIVVPGFPSEQVESVEPVLKVSVLALQLFVVHLRTSTCLHPRILFSIVEALSGCELTYHHLVHFCFAWLFLWSVCSLTFPLVLHALLVLALFFGLGAFQKRVAKFNV